MSENSNVKVDITASASGMQPAVSQAEQNFAKLEASANKVDAQFNTTNQTFNKATLSAGQLRMATQQLPLQFTDIWVSLAAGQSPMMVMLQQGTQITGSFGGVNNALKATGTYLLGLINPLTVTAAAVAAAGYAWYQYGEAARVAADKAREAAKSAEKDAAAAWSSIQMSTEQQISDLNNRIIGAQGMLDYALNKRNSITYKTDAAIAQSIGAEVLARRKEIEGYQRQLDQLQESASKKKLAPVLAIENDLFRKQMDLLGVSSAQVQVYELAMRGATKAEIDRAQAAADSIAQTDAQIDAEKRHKKAIEDTNKILADIDPLLKANQEWANLLSLKEQNLLTDEQMGRAYSKSMREIDKSGTDAFRSLERAVRGWGSQFTDEMTRAVRTAKADFSGLADSVINDLIRIQIQKRVTDPLIDAGTNVLDRVFNGSFEGGGYTGYGPRSGGLDGRGGFPAILHPNETVIDHTMSGSASVSRSSGASTAPSVVVNVINQSGQSVSAKQQSGPQLDGRDWVIGVVLEAADSNPHFRNAMGMG